MTSSVDRDSYDAIVVGAGPAGCAAALTLHRAGKHVVVVDKATFPRDKICGDGLTALALRLLDQLGLDPDSVETWRRVETCRVAGPDGRSHTFPLPSGQGQFAAISRRIDLDAALVRHCVAQGVEIREGNGVVDAAPDTEALVLTLDDGTVLRGSTVIAADGMWSPVRKLLGTPTPIYRGEFHAARQYFTNVGDAANDDLWVWFDEDLLPGYIWSFPLGNGRANVGFGVLRAGRDGELRRGKELGGLWADVIERPHVRAVLGPDAQPEGPHRTWPIPARVDNVELSNGRVLFVGDAAAATDLLTGEGIGQALLSGIEAARAVAAGGTTVEIAGRYETALRSHLVSDHKMSALLSKILATPSGARFALWAVDRNGWTRRNFARWLFEDYPRALVVTPRRWQRGMFSRPGAFQSPTPQDL